MRADPSPKQKQPTPISTPSKGLETEAINLSSKEQVEQISPEIELPQEVKQAGVEKLTGEVILPPDVQKLGVTSSGPHVPVTSTITTVILPLSDDQVVQGLNAPITYAIKWLALWCIRKLQKAHLILKKIHGKIIRVKV